MRILLVEDDAGLARDLADDLARAGYAVDVAGNGIDGQHLGGTEPYDAVILDLGLPDRGGLEVLGAWREAGLDVPVLILTARDAWHEKVAGFRAGADDYLAKPFHIEELQARLAALIRRAAGRSRPGLEAGGLALDEDRQTVRAGEAAPVPLTATEFRLLRYFMLYPDRILSKSQLAEHVYEYDADRDSNVIEVYVRRLRGKLGDGVIETRRGQGYRFRGRDG